MNDVLDILAGVLIDNGLVTAFAFVGITVWLSYLVSDRLTRGRVHGSAIAILIGLVLAGVGGRRDRAARTASPTSRCWPGWASWAAPCSGTSPSSPRPSASSFAEIRSAGIAAIVSLLRGCARLLRRRGGGGVAFGYPDAVSMTTIGAGAATYIVGPVTGTAIGASSDVVALSHRRRAGEVHDGHDRHALRRPLHRPGQPALRA